VSPFFRPTLCLGFTIQRRRSSVKQGNRYLLNVVYDKSAPAVIIRNNKIMDLYAQPASDTSTRERILIAWYRKHLKEDFMDKYGQ
jgi:hypothetical protein